MLSAGGRDLLPMCSKMEHLLSRLGLALRKEVSTAVNIISEVSDEVATAVNIVSEASDEVATAVNIISEGSDEVATAVNIASEVSDEVATAVNIASEASDRVATRVNTSCRPLPTDSHLCPAPVARPECGLIRVIPIIIIVHADAKARVVAYLEFHTAAHRCRVQQRIHLIRGNAAGILRRRIDSPAKERYAVGCLVAPDLDGLAPRKRSDE